MVFISFDFSYSVCYDLHKMGYQAIDIGHIDIEYEWFLQGATEKVKIDNKYTYEANGRVIKDIFNDEKYQVVPRYSE